MVYLSMRYGTLYRLLPSLSSFQAYRSGTSCGHLAFVPSAAASSFRVIHHHRKSHKTPPTLGYATTTTNAMSESEDVTQRKKRLRTKLRGRVKELSQEDVEVQSQQVWDKIIELPAYQSAKSVGLFLSMPKGEINTDFIINRAVSQGKEVYVPQVGANFELCDMELLKVPHQGDPTFHKKWPTNKWKIPEPPEDILPLPAASPGDIDLLIVPGLGFDAKGNRLGQGKGYYDRFISRMTTNSQTLPLVAVGLDVLFVDDEDIPVADYDRQMDKIVLPSRVIDPK